MQERDEDDNPLVQYATGLGLEAMRRDTVSGMDEGSASFFHYS